MAAIRGWAPDWSTPWRVSTEALIQLPERTYCIRTEITLRQNDHFLTGDVVSLQRFTYDLFRSAIGVDVGLVFRLAIGGRTRPI